MIYETFGVHGLSVTVGETARPDERDELVWVFDAEPGVTAEGGGLADYGGHLAVVEGRGQADPGVGHVDRAALVLATAVLGIADHPPLWAVVGRLATLKQTGT